MEATHSEFCQAAFEGTPPFLDDLIALCSRPVPPTDAELAHAVRSVDISPDDAIRAAHFNPQHYTRWTVLRNEHVQILVLGWLASQGSAIHDHGGSLCIFRVLAGVASETRYELDPAGKATPVALAHVATGETACSRDADIHRVFNDGAQGPLVSLHVYAPPLNMNFYESAV